MTSELDILTAGVTFARDAHGRIVPSGPPGVDLRSAVAERLEMVRARMAGGPPMDGGARCGVCDTCGSKLGVTCDRLCCSPTRSRTATYEKRHAACCHTLDESNPQPGTPQRCYAIYGSNRSGTCWLCQCAAQKILALRESAPQAAARVVERVAPKPTPYVDPPWEASDPGLERLSAKFRAANKGMT